MTELEKLEAGLEYCYDDPEVEARKENAIIQCKEYNGPPGQSRGSKNNLDTKKVTCYINFENVTCYL